MRQPCRRLRRHVNEKYALDIAAVDPDDTHVAWRRNDPLADQLTVPVQIRQVSGHRAYPIENLPVVFLPGGVAHQQQAAVLRVRERGHVLGQLFSAARIVEQVDTALRIKPAAFGQTNQLLRMARTQRLTGTIDVVNGHLPSMAIQSNDISQITPFPWATQLD